MGGWTDRRTGAITIFLKKMCRDKNYIKKNICLTISLIMCIKVLGRAQIANPDDSFEYQQHYFFLIEIQENCGKCG